MPDVEHARGRPSAPCRSEFGLGFGPADAMLGDVVKIQLDMQFVEPE
jgi:hypothetical protein